MYVTDFHQYSQVHFWWASMDQLTTILLVENVELYQCGITFQDLNTPTNKLFPTIYLNASET